MKRIHFSWLAVPTLASVVAVRAQTSTGTVVKPAPQSAPARGARIIAIALLAITLVLSSATSVRAQEKEKANADAEFLTQVVPNIAASVKIIEYAQKNASDEKDREFAGRVLKQHKESVKTASGHAKRLNVAVDTSGEKDSKEMIDKLSKLKGSELDVAFLEWLGHIHHDTRVFENEVKNGADPDLKTRTAQSPPARNIWKRRASSWPS